MNVFYINFSYNVTGHRSDQNKLLKMPDLLGQTMIVHSQTCELQLDVLVAARETGHFDTKSFRYELKQ